MNLSIGYWIKRADELLTNGINGLHASFGIDRTAWQIIHSINEGNTTDKPGLITIMKPFADPYGVENVLEKLKADHLVIQTDDRFSLTDKGQALHRSCLERQTVFRQSSIAGIAPGDYETTVVVLQKLVENLTRISKVHAT